MEFKKLIDIISSSATVIVAVVTLVVAVLVYRVRGKVKVGNVIVDFERRVAAEKAIEDSLSGNDLDPSERQYRLLRAYHTQSLAQSRTSMWFSLVFAALGFAVIVTAILTTEPNASKIIKLTSGTIIDAVAGLFFVQSNKARELMAAFFDKLRTDRKLDESLRLVERIADPTVKSRLQMVLSLNFAGVQLDNATLLSLADVSGTGGASSTSEHRPNGLSTSLESQPLAARNVTTFPTTASAASVEAKSS